jgi:15-cis-phytoene synthase
MTLFTHTWERPLLSMALMGHNVTAAAGHKTIVKDEAQLSRAYAYCEEITAVHSRSFHMASSLLPEDKRRAVRALYAFCRTTDDIVDDSTGDASAELSVWREHALSLTPPTDDLVALAWADTRLRYHIPVTYADQLLTGVARDLFQTRYDTFDELATYAYGVASTVGLMSMHIIGFNAPEAIPYAIKLGVALQVTNILRDVGEDWQRGRLYLPLEDLQAFNLTEDDIARGVVNDDWREFMRYQIIRNRQLYAEAWPGIGMLNRDGRFSIGAAAGLYQAILNDIEQHDYDVFNRRAHVNAWGKLRRLPGIWRRSRSAAPAPATLPHQLSLSPT